VQVGQELKVAVLDVDSEHRRIFSSIKKVRSWSSGGPASIGPEKPKKPRPQLRGGLVFRVQEETK